jgi:hypothetical protein
MHIFRYFIMKDFISLNNFLCNNSINFGYDGILMYAGGIYNCFKEKSQSWDIVSLEQEMNSTFDNFKISLFDFLRWISPERKFQFISVFASPWAWKSTFQNEIITNLVNASIISTGTWWFMKNPEWLYAKYFQPFSDVIQYFRWRKIYTKWWFVQYCILVDVIGKIVLQNSDCIIGDVWPWWIDQWVDRESVLHNLKESWCDNSIKNILIFRTIDDFDFPSHYIVDQWKNLAEKLKKLKDSNDISTEGIKDLINSMENNAIFMQDYENSKKAVLGRWREWENEEIFNVRYCSNVVMNYSYLYKSSSDLKIIYNNWSKDDFILAYN